MDGLDPSRQAKVDNGSGRHAESHLTWRQASEVSSDGLSTHSAQFQSLELASVVQDIRAKLLQSLSLGVIVVDGRCRVLFADALARQLLLRGDVMAESWGQLRPTHPASGKMLLKLIRRMSEGELIDAQVIRLSDVTGRPLLVLVQAVVEADRSPTGKVLLLTSDRVFGGDLVPANLGSLYELTRSELRLVGALLRGQSLKCYAAAASLTCNTVRSQLKTIFQKTGFGRQAELVSAILGNPVMHLIAHSTEGAAARSVHRRAPRIPK